MKNQEFQTKSDSLLLQPAFLSDEAFCLYWHCFLDAKAKRNRIMERMALAGLAEAAVRLGDTRMAGACYLQLYLIDANSATPLGAALMLLRLAKSYQSVGLFADAWSAIDLVARKLERPDEMPAAAHQYLLGELEAWRAAAAENSTADLIA